ncbi:MAG: hydrogenase subunit MbhD domain-containing protein [Halieaceae bacterium]|jgi:multisubunit Na+/H+ antiporter MnhB subunit|nr:hydrogenase subunit MbhD domain-containing protein [Halieaceae bacterium]
MTGVLFNVALAVLVLGLAVWTIIAREAFAAVVGFIAYGLLLTLVWVQLQGIDVALTEAAIGGGLTGVLLIGAAARLRGIEAAPGAERPRNSLYWMAGAVSAAVTAVLVICVLALPDPAPTLAHEVALNIVDTGVANPITAVLLAFRPMDTLLEAIVLVFALIGVWSLAPDDSWGGRPGPVQQSDPNGILAYAARILPPLGIVIGIYIFWTGADYPGGKFQGATILAAMWLLLMMAGLSEAPPISRGWLRVGLVAGPLVFIAIGFIGVLTAGDFFGYPQGLAKPLIVAIELALMPSLTLVLGLLMVGAPQRVAKL